MKNHALVLLFLLSGLSWLASAQGPGVLTSIPSNGNHNMVRFDAVTGGFIAASSHSGGVIHFIKTDLLNYSEVIIEVNATIMDFEIIDRFIFFCGEKFPYGGFLGCINIDSLFTLGVGAHMDMDLYSTVGLTSLRNIEVFKDGSVYHIAGFGRDVSLDPVAFEAVGHPYTGMKYRTLLLEYGNYKNEILDMAVTDNYVVYLRHHVGRLWDCVPYYNWGITLIPFKKFNMFDPSLLPAYFFQTSVNSTYGSDVYVENIEPAGYLSKIVQVDGDNVAVCAHRRENDFLNCYPANVFCDCERNYVKTYLTLRHYNLTPLAANSPIVMTSACAAVFNNGETTSIPGFKYDKSNKNYLVLHRHETSPGVQDYCVTAFDFSGGVPAFASSEYQTIHSTTSEWEPYNLCLDNSSHYLVGGADRLSLSHYYFWLNNVVGSTVSACNNIIDNPVVDVPLVNEKNLINMNTPTTWYLLSLSTYRTQVIASAGCEQICPQY